jgi:hypothetical protein
MCRTIKSPLKNKEMRRSSFQPSEDRGQSGATARESAASACHLVSTSGVSLTKVIHLFAGDVPRGAMGVTVTLVATKSIKLPGSDEFFGRSG